MERRAELPLDLIETLARQLVAQPGIAASTYRRLAQLRAEDPGALRVAMHSRAARARSPRWGVKRTRARRIALRPVRAHSTAPLSGLEGGVETRKRWMHAVETAQYT